MKPIHRSTIKTKALMALALAIATFTWGTTAQANVDVAQQPLIVAPAIPPNILFILDDSGSMQWSFIPDGIFGARTTDRAKSSTFNAQYYDPEYTYQPPVDADGESLGDADFTAAWTNGYAENRDNSTVDLSADFRPTWYYSWTAQAYAGPEEPAYYFEYAPSCGNVNDDACYSKVQVSATSGPGGADERTNFANWYSYYRTRLMSAKASMTIAFSEFGLASDGTTEIGQDIQLGWGRINQSPSVEEDLAQFGGTHRQNFFQWIFDTPASGSTPLRRALYQAGEYYEENAWDDGVSCRQSYTILNTDGFWNGNFSGLGNADGQGGGEITGPSGRAFQYQPGPPFAADDSDMLADIAMHFWKRDLKPDLTNNVPTNRENPAFWQHMVTIGLGLGVEPAGLPSGWDVDRIFASILDDDDEFPEDGWPTPVANTATTITDLAHAAVNSRGQFYATQSPEEFADGIREAVRRATERVGASSSVAANSTELETDSRIYQAQYVSGTWAGDLRAFDLDPDTGVASDNPVWSASEELPLPNDRGIYSTRVQGNSLLLEPFEWPEFSEVGSEAVLDYIRGDQSLEQQNGVGDFRDRESVLGSLINSQPVFVGAPSLTRFLGAGFSGSDDYQQFAEDNIGRTPVVYIGGNDGMLHGFNADTGEELFAFIPRFLVNDLAALADPAYEHQYFVDGELTVADVYLPGGQGGWKTILVGTLGRGGPGAFALDVTDPNDIEILWELDGDAFGDELGQNLGKPIIAQVADGDWRVLMGNGANASDGGARLVSVGIDDGDITTILAETGDSNALAGIAAWDAEGDGFTDTVYAGDMEGNVWRFDLDNNSRELLFAAEDSSGNPQPITAAPLVGIDPQTGRTWVFVGTGRYLGESDLDDTSVQTWYGLIDDGSTIDDRDDLVERQIEAQTTVSGREVRTIEDGSASDFEDATTGEQRRGWYIDLVANSNPQGERMVTPNQFRANVLIGQTRIPDGSDPCEPTGRGFIYAINPFTGARLPFTFFDVDGDGDFTDADMMDVNGELVPVSAIGTVSSPNQPTFVGDSMQISTEDGQIESVRTQTLGTDTGRMSWREIIMQ
ncbi:MULTISPECIES: pilus assembly protein [unclassified Thioalkalivibrio]|uniref:pilus assembly protein n=1 Tax=unclassified Thioalkalivibrio TaxID=2621013 RepID=UPI000366B28A|nr:MULTISPECIES: PilC/PilY family type IV pilus protein [unclassified Thioalkalivibrio]